MLCIYRSGSGTNPPMIGNAKQKSCSGKYLEYEATNAFVAASYSSGSLSGCPLSQFLRLAIAELSRNQKYVLEPGINNFPASLDDILIGILSSSNSSWFANLELTFDNVRCEVLGGSVLLCDYMRCKDGDQCDGAMACVQRVVGGFKAVKAPNEENCYQDNVGGDEVAKIYNNHIKNKCKVAVGVVSKLADIKRSGKAMKTAMTMGECNLMKITKQAGQLVFIPVFRDSQYTEQLSTY